MALEKVIIIGANAAGMTLASNLNRKGKEKIELVVYERRSYVSLGACGIPYYVGNHAQSINMLTQPTVEEHLNNGINLKVNHEVLEIDFTNKKIKIKDLQKDKIIFDSYDKLFIGLGASPVKPQWFDQNNSKMLTATSLEDAIAIKQAMAKKDIQDIVIVGGGFIGLELAENIATQNKNVTIIERNNQVMLNTIDQALAASLHEYLNNFITLKLNTNVESIEQKKEKLLIKTNKESQVIKADLIIVAIGFRPNTQLVEGHLKLSSEKAIIIDSYGQTSDPNVFAGGDCAIVIDRVSGQNFYWPLATTAQKIARVVANNLLGNQQQFLGTLGSSGLRFNDLEFFKTGIVNQQLLAKFYPQAKQVIIKDHDSAKYAGRAKSLILKLIVSGDGVLIGAEALGFNKSAALRIAALAMAIWNKMPIEQLMQVDLFYSPPFSRANDIIHIAASKLAKM